MNKWVVCIAAASLSMTACGDDGSKKTVKSIIIGGVFIDDVDEAARLRLNAVRMAAEEMTAAGVLPLPVTVDNRPASKGGAADKDLAAEEAKKLHDVGAVGVVTMYSSIAGAINAVTNVAPYDDFVQCSSSATSPVLNNPTSSDPGADKSDVFYRTVVNDTVQGALLSKLLEEIGNKNVAIYYQKGPFGEGIKDVVSSTLPSDFSVTVIEFPESEFSVATNQDDLNGLIDGGYDVVLVAAVQSPSSEITNYLTAHDYRGVILLTDGASDDALFSVATTVGTWLQKAGNDLLGVNPDNYAGVNSAGFRAAFKAKYDEEPNSYSSTAYDCGYAIGLSLLLAGAKDTYVPQDVKTNIAAFKEENRGAAPTVVGIGKAGFAAAATSIANGEDIVFEGASGELIFDSTGDRPRQPIYTYEYDPDTGNTWKRRTCYDDDLVVTTCLGN